MKKLLEHNHKILAYTVKYVYPLGLIFLVLIGVCIYTGEPLQIPVFKSKLSSYILVFSTTVIMVMYLTDLVYGSITDMKQKTEKGMNYDNTLLSRIRRAEKGEYDS